MEQQTAAMAASTLPRHALRALLLLGGAALWWLVFLSGGAAHADDLGVVTHDGSVALEKAVSGSDATGLVEHAAHRGSGTLRQSPALLTTTVRDETASAPAPVVATLQSLTTVADPGLSLATDAVADRLDGAVDRAGAVLAPTLHRVGIDAPREVSKARSATASGPAPRHGRSTVRERTSGEQSSASPAKSVEAVSHPEAGAPTKGRDGLPTGSVPPAPALPGTGSTGGPASAAMFGVLALMLPVRRIRRLSNAIEVGSGPAYPPGSSPD